MVFRRFIQVTDTPVRRINGWVGFITLIYSALAVLAGWSSRALPWVSYHGLRGAVLFSLAALCVLLAASGLALLGLAAAFVGWRRFFPALPLASTAASDDERLLSKSVAETEARIAVLENWVADIPGVSYVLNEVTAVVKDHYKLNVDFNNFVASLSKLGEMLDFLEGKTDSAERRAKDSLDGTRVGLLDTINRHALVVSDMQHEFGLFRAQVTYILRARDTEEVLAGIETRADEIWTTMMCLDEFTSRKDWIDHYQKWKDQISLYIKTFGAWETPNRDPFEIDERDLLLVPTPNHRLLSDFEIEHKYRVANVAQEQFGVIRHQNNIFLRSYVISPRQIQNALALPR